MVLVTYPAPDFTASAISCNGDIINNFNFKEFTNNQTSILFFWPMDFTFVCPSEIIAFNQELSKFKKRNVKLIGVSIDSVYVHHAWRNTLSHNGQIDKINFTMVSDLKREIQRSYGIEHPQLGVALRATFLIDKNRIIRHQTINDLPFGRNISETLRMIDALHFYEKYGEVCPANWKKGDTGIKTTQEGIHKYLEKISKK
ncbi:peroxiredoxin 2 [Buchnera aphidicola str. Bp (Baizongia pistaciae)]|uniref:Alkyl hydroperoxide reductase C n=1 Tax=Buchnera aphidicola subsp. Baizongia pistaciae (strain Bp) TaxID=224915 RepID=AHPC_BUCBP|nr:redoxin domain-containing protein [Buchnera aphidicola]Q89AS1.1 RecName: Full=Alkyl hydroperoxide reductase C; AltName: Full=Peroxiredoxin; AltName: Full=Thioredoxin peroxidase [Buchnera aphidicola str. Bp (Baizongia pistaciae)]AAO26904.1 peroxiredoxin 2 [Buchnera aphidicola str. Bp (Baizongia pistaciae)]